MSRFGIIVVEGSPSDNWPGADEPGRKWGFGSRVRVEGKWWMVVGAIVDGLGFDMMSLRRYEPNGDEEWLSIPAPDLDALVEADGSTMG